MGASSFRLFVCIALVAALCRGGWQSARVLPPALRVISLKTREAFVSASFGSFCKGATTGTPSAEPIALLLGRQLYQRS